MALKAKIKLPADMNIYLTIISGIKGLPIQDTRIGNGIRHCYDKFRKS